jgi:6-phosphogluconate dehydrogenase (decarboxylating)
MQPGMIDLGRMGANTLSAMRYQFGGHIGKPA